MINRIGSCNVGLNVTRVRRAARRLRVWRQYTSTPQCTSKLSSYEIPPQTGPNIVEWSRDRNSAMLPIRSNYPRGAGMHANARGGSGLSPRESPRPRSPGGEVVVHCWLFHIIGYVVLGIARGPVYKTPTLLKLNLPLATLL